MEDIRHP